LKAGKAEKDFFHVFATHFQDSEFMVQAKPKDFKDAYSSVQLSPEIQSRIYNPSETWTHGFTPDFSITNTSTKKKIYIEVKRQDGWVEDKPRSAGRGNVHERSCKFFTPGLLGILRAKSGILEPHLPFWVVFQGDIARDPKRAREISLWYLGVENHFFLWSNSTDESQLLTHFEEKIKSLLL
jgi:hypothetical protein